MSWRELPILPLCRIYECLSIEDCLNASTCCKNWRHAFKFHRMKRDHLRLKIDSENFEKNLFLADTYSRNIKELQVSLASSIDEYSKFTTVILKRFCESKYLNYITYVPTFEYLTFERTHNKEFVQRVLISPLLQFCSLPSLRGININGCSEVIVHTPALLQAVRYPESFKLLGLAKIRPTYSPVNSFNSNIFHSFISLQYLSLDYGYLSEELLVGIQNRMVLLKKLVLNITSVPTQGFQDLSSSWFRLRVARISFTVTINCIRLPSESLNDINQHVLNPSIPLEVIRIMFCKTINMDILRKLVHYNDTLKELVWVDSIVTGAFKNGLGVVEGRRRSSRRATRQQTPNPLVMMCWQCSFLEKIIIHGYWHSAHDLLGMARLRGSSLQALDVSALLHAERDYRPRQPFAPTRLSREDLSLDGPYLPDGFIQKMKCALSFPWNTPKWCDLHPSLRGDPEDGASQILDYILKIIENDLPSMKEVTNINSI